MTLVRVTVKVRFNIYLLRLLHFYQAYCTLIVPHCHVVAVAQGVKYEDPQVVL